MYSHNGIPFSNENEQSKIICNNMAESHKHKPDIKNKKQKNKTIVFSLYIKNKYRVKLIYFRNYDIIYSWRWVKCSDYPGLGYEGSSWSASYMSMLKPNHRDAYSTSVEHHQK